MQTFKSKIDAWLAVVLVGTPILSVVFVVKLLLENTSGQWFSAMIIFLAGTVLPIWMLLGTRYRITEQALKVASGPFFWTIPLQNITSIAATKNPLSSPALSLDRLQIRHSGGKSLLVSPKDKDAFVQALGKNPV